MYAASIPLNDSSNPPKDDSKDLTYFGSDGTGDHNISKRHTNAGRVFALKEQAHDAKNIKVKRDTKQTTNTDTDPDTDPKN